MTTTTTTTDHLEIDPVTLPWVRTASDRAAVSEGCYFDPEAAERPIIFIERFIKVADPKNPAKSIPMELMQWQRDEVIRPLFGWKRQDGTRRFRTAWIEIAKKNGKSTLAAALVLYLLLADGEADPEVYSAATTRNQAGIIYKEAAKMLGRSPALQEYIQAKDHVKRLVSLEVNGFYSVLSNKPSANDGINASALIFDEIHQLPKRDLYDVLVYSGAARRQPIQVYITTAGDDRQSIGGELHDRADKVLSGAVIDTELLAYIAAADQDDDPSAPETWRKGNPSLGVTLREADLAKEYERIKDSPAGLQNFRRYRLNQWTSNVSRWLDYDRWAACPPRAPIDQLAGRECYAGLDLSSKHDITALVLQFPSQDADGRMIHDVLSYFWLPAENIEHAERTSGMPYRAWAQQGLIELTPGDYIDYGYVRRRILEISKSYKLRELAFDPAYAGQIAIQLADEGIQCFEFWQRVTMMNPVLRYTESAVIEGRIRHGDNPIMNWMVSNVEVSETSDNLIKPVKPKGSAKIDGVVSLAMSMGTHCKGTGWDANSNKHFYNECPLILF